MSLTSVTQSPRSTGTGTATRGLRRAATVAALTAAAVLAGAGAAFAHVTVHPDSYPQGASDGTLTFRVPNEEDKADTTQVDVFFPAAQPIASVLVAPLPGWTSTVKTVKLAKPIVTDDGNITDAVSEVLWTGGKIAPGQYQDFTVAFGQLPTGVDQLVFKALQTYSDGNVVRWIDETVKGQPEPDHPAPVLTLTAPVPDGGDSAAPSAAPSAAASAAPNTSAAATAAKPSDSTARGLGIAALVVAVLALAAAGLGLVRARSRQ
ncbi:YcnI family copper-binding membrane protein [Streptacidiphilus cavernicola]|uniref:YcnI family protein n=1 Tax=Streptacidiphilus cavernicola TaxID=3342716 RepID=A0ABV6VZA6_9ACTN